MVHMTGQSVICTAGSATPLAALSLASTGLGPVHGRGAYADAITLGYRAFVSSEDVIKYALVPGLIQLKFEVDGVEVPQYPPKMVTLRYDLGKTCMRMNPGAQTCRALEADGKLHRGYRKHADGSLVIVMGSDARRVALEGRKVRLA